MPTTRLRQAHSDLKMEVSTRVLAEWERLAPISAENRVLLSIVEETVRAWLGL